MIYMINKIVAIQGDQLSKLNPKTDTSIYLAIGAQKLKYKIFYYEPSNLSIIGNKVVAKGHFVIFNYSKKKFFKIKKFFCFLYNEPEPPLLLREVQVEDF